MRKSILILLTLVFSILLFSCTRSQIDFYLLGPGDTIDNVRQRIYLKTELNNDIITWTSSDENYILENGNVIRPLANQDSVQVSLTANYKNKEYQFDFTVTPLTGDLIYDLYPSLNDQNHIIEAVTYEQIIKILEDKNEALIYMGFETCPWCKEYLPIFNRMAKNQGFEKIYYYDFREIRMIEGDQLNQDFSALINLIDEEYLINNPTNNQLKWLFAPTFIGLNNHEIKGFFTGAILNHQASQNYLTDSQLDELKLIFNEIITQTRPNDTGCEC
jgi:predicted bacteriocin transport accessory protein